MAARWWSCANSYETKQRGEELRAVLLCAPARHCPDEFDGVVKLESDVSVNYTIAAGNTAGNDIGIVISERRVKHLGDGFRVVVNNQERQWVAFETSAPILGALFHSPVAALALFNHEATALPILVGDLVSML